MELEGKIRDVWHTAKKIAVLGTSLAILSACSSNLPDKYNVEGTDLRRIAGDYFPYDADKAKSLPDKIKIKDLTLKRNKYGFYVDEYTDYGFGSSCKGLPASVTINDEKFYCGKQGRYYPQFDNLPSEFSIEGIGKFKFDGQKYVKIKQNRKF